MNEVTMENSLLLVKQESDEMNKQKELQRSLTGYRAGVTMTQHIKTVRRISIKDGSFKNNITLKQGSRHKFKFSRSLVNFFSPPRL